MHFDITIMVTFKWMSGSEGVYFVVITEKSLFLRMNVFICVGRRHQK